MCDGLGVRQGEIAYAKAGEHHIAFREYVGDGVGGHEVVMVSGVYWSIEAFAVAPPDIERLLQGLAGVGRLVLFDRRGVGLSDPVTDWDTPLVEQWTDDLTAVVSAAGCDRPAVFSWNWSPIGESFAARHPDLVGPLILFNPTAPLTVADTDWVTELVESMRRVRAGEYPRPGDLAMPERAQDPDFQAWNDAAGRIGASPSQVSRLEQKAAIDPWPDLGAIRARTLVLNRRPSDYVVPAEFNRRAVDLIPGAELVVLPPGDASVLGCGVDDLLAEITRFVVGEVRLPEPDRRLAAILFTDIVASTQHAASSGDAAWKRMLDRHDHVCRVAVERRGGEVVKTTGDGILAVFPSATAAIDVARTIRTALTDEHLEVRTGIHVGEIDLRAGDISGLAVNVAARIMSRAGAGQILASAITTQASMILDHVRLEPTTLKGVDGTWDLHVIN